MKIFSLLPPLLMKITKMLSWEQNLFLKKKILFQKVLSTREKKKFPLVKLVENHDMDPYAFESEKLLTFHSEKQ